MRADHGTKWRNVQERGWEAAHHDASVGCPSVVARPPPQRPVCGGVCFVSEWFVNNCEINFGVARSAFCRLYTVFGLSTLRGSTQSTHRRECPPSTRC